MSSDGSAAAPAAASATPAITSRELARHTGAAFSSPYSIVVTRERVLAFAELTGADHWMHVDADRAAASPLGPATVPGLLTLSLGALRHAVQAVFLHRFRSSGPKPVCVAEQKFRYTHHEQP